MEYFEVAEPVYGRVEEVEEEGELPRVRSEASALLDGEEVKP